MTEQLESIVEQLDALRLRAVQQLGPINTSSALDEWSRRYLGRNRGELTKLYELIPALPKEERRVIGQRVNAVKNELELLLNEKREVLRQRELVQALEQERIDVTLPGRTQRPGYMHPVSRIILEITQIFQKMGFWIVQGPEVETDYYNFRALNFPPDHPARDMQDSFWIVPGEILLRTQTSPMQMRIMQNMLPPVRAVVPGRVFREEDIDATHEAVFHQVEGLLIDEQCTMADLKGCLERFAREMFGANIRTRFRGSYFPFTEPSAEMDVSCTNCDGAGCSTCKYTGWIELLGAGMVDPRVLREAGYDPMKYRGFAFGVGVERVAMAKYVVPDVRFFSQNDLHLLRQF